MKFSTYFRCVTVGLFAVGAVAYFRGVADWQPWVILAAVCLGCDMTAVGIKHTTLET